MKLILTRRSPLNTILFEELTGKSMYQTHTPNASKKFTNRRTIISRIRPTQENDNTQIRQIVDDSEDSSDGSEISDTEAIAAVQWKIIGPSRFSFSPSTEDISANVYLPFSGMFLQYRTFVGPDGLTYKWSFAHPGERYCILQLNDASETMIARSHTGSSTSASILEIINESPPDVLDAIVITFLYVEKIRRYKHNQERSG